MSPNILGHLFPSFFPQEAVVSIRDHPASWTQARTWRSKFPGRHPTGRQGPCEEWLVSIEGHPKVIFLNWVLVILCC